MSNDKQFSDYQEFLTIERKIFKQEYKRDNISKEDVPDSVVQDNIAGIERKAIIRAINYILAYVKENRPTQSQSEPRDADRVAEGTVEQTPQPKAPKAGEAKKATGGSSKK